MTKSISQNKWRKRRSRDSTSKKGNKSMKSGSVILWNLQFHFEIEIKPSGAHSFQDSSFVDQQVFLYTLPRFVPPFVQIFIAQTKPEQWWWSSERELGQNHFQRPFQPMFLWFSVQQEADTREAEKTGVIRVQKPLHVCMLILFG